MSCSLRNLELWVTLKNPPLTLAVSLAVSLAETRLVEPTEITETMPSSHGSIGSQDIPKSDKKRHAMLENGMSCPVSTPSDVMKHGKLGDPRILRWSITMVDGGYHLVMTNTSSWKITSFNR